MFEDPCIKTIYLKMACERTKKLYPQLYNLIEQSKFLENPYRLVDEACNSLMNKDIFADWLVQNGETCSYSPGVVAKFLFIYVVPPTTLLDCLRNQNEDEHFSFKRILCDKTLTRKGRKVLEERVDQFVKRNGILDFVLAYSKFIDKIYCGKRSVYEGEMLKLIQEYPGILDLAAMLLHMICWVPPDWLRQSWVLLEAMRLECQTKFLNLLCALVEYYARKSCLAI